MTSNFGTITINNFFRRSEYEFQCYIDIDKSILKNDELTDYYNQIIDGHKLLVISKLISKQEPDFVYSNGMWFYFTGNYWRKDDEALLLRKKILQVVPTLKKILAFYTSGANLINTDAILIVRNINCLINKLYKPEAMDEIIQGAKMYYHDESLCEKLDSRKHLIPFTNGVYDLLKFTFRKTSKSDFVTKTTKFKYNATASNPKCNEFIQYILPDLVQREAVLKKLSEYLNRDINTPPLMFSIDTPLATLMKLVLGDIYPRKRPTKHTRPIELPPVQPKYTHDDMREDISIRQTFMNILIEVYKSYF
ncbi:hypothetical protein EB118_08810 [bacterium]|nr:hypothetical protein [bacterium]NDC94660.1 hypothetical protein [bacterium]NDD84302.1 hypothetical protein [bacterium]NDG30162.1 hypothetical protein [bacterium]